LSVFVLLRVVGEKRDLESRVEVEGRKREEGRNGEVPNHVRI